MSQKEPLILNGFAGASVAADVLPLAPILPPDLLVRPAIDKLPSTVFPVSALAKILHESSVLLSYVYVPVTRYSPLLYVMPDGASSALVIARGAQTPRQLLWTIKVSWSSTMLVHLQQP